MKLKLNKQIPIAPVKAGVIPVSGYESPLGWWGVSTEGDCEDRTTTQLGEYYGHVAEIAFHLANRSSYSLQFKPIKNKERGKRIILQATRKNVWIYLDISSNTWGMSAENRAQYIAKWLDVSEEVDVKGNTANASYYASVYLTLK